MDEVKTNFTEELRNVIKQEIQEQDEAIYCTQFSDTDRQSTETKNVESSDVVYKNQVQIYEMKSEIESCSNREEQSCSKEFCKVVNKITSSHLENIIYNSAEEFQCTICSKTFRLQRYLKAHLKRHSTEEFQCTICSKTFRLQVYLKSHLRTHSAEEFQCTICSKTFRLQRYLKAHFKKTHSTEQTDSALEFQCTICSKTFPLQRALSAHLTTHSTERMDSAEEFQCTISSKTKRYLKAYLKAHSTEQTYSAKEFQCNICSKTFRLLIYLKAHLRCGECWLQSV